MSILKAYKRIKTRRNSPMPTTTTPITTAATPNGILSGISTGISSGISTGITSPASWGIGGTTTTPYYGPHTGNPATTWSVTSPIMPTLNKKVSILSDDEDACIAKLSGVDFDLISEIITNIDVRVYPEYCDISIGLMPPNSKSWTFINKYLTSKTTKKIVIDTLDNDKNILHTEEYEVKFTGMSYSWSKNNYGTGVSFTFSNSSDEDDNEGTNS